MSTHTTSSAKKFGAGVGIIAVVGLGVIAMLYFGWQGDVDGMRAFTVAVSCVALAISSYAMGRELLAKRVSSKSISFAFVLSIVGLAAGTYGVVTSLA